MGGLNLAADFGSVREGSAVAFCSVPIWVRAFDVRACRRPLVYHRSGRIKRAARFRREIYMSGITPCLWFDGNAEEAAKFYVSLFHNRLTVENR